jgi:hypothetical protein
MHRTPVSSSSIASVGYRPSSRTLELEYRGGGVYQYLDVPPREYDSLMRVDSKGRFVNARIKGRYRYRRVK